MGLLTCQPQGEVGWISVLLPSGRETSSQKGSPSTRCQLGAGCFAAPLSSHPTPSLQGYHTIYFRLPGGSERESKLSKVTQPGSSRNEM